MNFSTTSASEVIFDTRCSVNVPINTTIKTILWADQTFIHRIVEIIYLSIISILGTFGNLTVIFSIIAEKRVHAHGNIFIINLAIADLLVTGFVVPTVIANVIESGNALSEHLCTAVGYTVTVTCTCSLCNLTLIAFNRYWAVVRSKTYVHKFSNARAVFMMLGSWMWSNLLTLPILVGWSRTAYDDKIVLCSWDDDCNYGFTIFIGILAIFVPLCAILICYYKLFMAVRTSGRWVRSLSTVNGSHQNSEQNRRSMQKERNLLQTLATAFAVFCVCWLPYGSTIIIDMNGSIPAFPKKIFGWLGMSNSAVNFVIYGAMNRVYRRGYINLFHLVFTCKRPRNRLNSTQLHVSRNSDSNIRSQYRKKSASTPASRLSMLRKNSNALVTHSSGISSQPKMAYRNEATKVWTTNGNSESCTETPQIKKSSNKEPKNGVNKMISPVILKDQLKPAVASSLTAFKRPTSFLKKNRSVQLKKKMEDREGRLKRNSLMLLQIEMGDDDDDDVDNGDIKPMDHRRTKSEIPQGVKRPVRKKLSGPYSSISHSMTEGTKHYKHNREEKGTIDIKITPSDDQDFSKTDSDSESSNSSSVNSMDISDSQSLNSVGIKPLPVTNGTNQHPVSDTLERSARLRNSMRQKEIIEGFVNNGAKEVLPASEVSC